MNKCNTELLERTIDLSVIEVNKNKNPKGPWKQFQDEIPPISSWYGHFLNDGYIGIITGRVSGNFEVLDIDSKNDPTNRITQEFRKFIPEEIYKKLVVVITPSGGQHYYYRCSVIESNQVLAKHSDSRTIIETRGEGGYVCHHVSDYEVIQGAFNLETMDYVLHELTIEERDLLLSAARSLDRTIGNVKSNFTYKEDAINKFNSEYPIIGYFEKYNWSVTHENDDKVFILRPGSTAQHSGVYFKKDKIFFCFSSSTEFKVGRPYNHFQSVQVLENIIDHRTTLRLLGSLGYPSEKVRSKKDKISDQQIADFCRENGVRYNTFIQEITINGKVLEEMDNNTLFIELKEHFDQDIPRSTFENVIKSHLIEKEDPIEIFINKYKDRKPKNAIEQWVNCLNLKNENIPRDVITYFVKKWYVGLIAQCLDGEYPNEFFIAILSTRQGVGKTTFLRKYTLPEELQGYRKEVSIHDDEDFKLIMSQAILIIDDEMDGRTLNEDKTFKAILSRKELPLRRKYDRRQSTLIRRCSFAGCGNQINVVRERQNRRIIPIEISSIDYEKVKLIDQIDMFIEAYHLFISGFSYSYDGSDSEKINQLAGDYLLRTDLDEIIDDCVINPSNENDVFTIPAIDLMKSLVYKYPTFSKKVNTVTIGKVLADKGIESKRTGTNKTTVYMISNKSKVISILKDLENPITGQEVGFERK